jgi:uncharacterized protein YabN with tetrapyrrole methylase and pyrophosphatase domain
MSFGEEIERRCRKCGVIIANYTVDFSSNTDEDVFVERYPHTCKVDKVEELETKKEAWDKLKKISAYLTRTTTEFYKIQDDYEYVVEMTQSINDAKTLIHALILTLQWEIIKEELKNGTN